MFGTMIAYVVYITTKFMTLGYKARSHQLMVRNANCQFILNDAVYIWHKCCLWGVDDNSYLCIRKFAGVKQGRSIYFNMFYCS